MILQEWHKPITITRNSFKFKSLSSWACNVAVGCRHACRFCYVPEVSTRKMKLPGVQDPDAEWGEYVFVRPFQSAAFRASLARAMKEKDLNPDGNRAVMFCSTTDAYQALPDPVLQKKLLDSVEQSLRIIRDESDLNVRILTRSPLALKHLDLFESFGPRLLLGVSLPTMSEKLAKIYEPQAPGPVARLRLLRAAKEAGLHVYVAMAPTPPEQTLPEIVNILQLLAPLKPVTVFHEPINIRAENVARITKHAAALGEKLKLETWESKDSWAKYAVDQLMTVEEIAHLSGLGEALHLWPDQELGKLRPDLKSWLESHWNKISKWPS